MTTYSPYPMVLNGVYIGMVDLRSDQIAYFNIPPATTAELEKAKYKIGATTYTKKVYSQRLDTRESDDTTTVKRRARTKNRKKLIAGRGGKPIKVPTELLSTPAVQTTSDGNSTVIKRPSVRYTTIKFPGAADLSEISAWLHLKLVGKKPKFMKSPAGSTYPIAPFATGDVATGSGDTTP